MEAGAVLDGAISGGFGVTWSKACDMLRCELGEDKFGSWIAPAHLRPGVSGEMVVVTPTGLARDWIKRNAWRRIDELWTQYDPEHRRLALKSRTEFEDGAPTASLATQSQQAPVAAPVAEVAASVLSPDRLTNSPSQLLGKSPAGQTAASIRF
jgi:chromosomal replication initiator protein